MLFGTDTVSNRFERCVCVCLFCGKHCELRAQCDQHKTVPCVFWIGSKVAADTGGGQAFGLFFVVPPKRSNERGFSPESGAKNSVQQANAAFSSWVGRFVCVDLVSCHKQKTIRVFQENTHDPLSLPIDNGAAVDRLSVSFPLDAFVRTSDRSGSGAVHSGKFCSIFSVCCSCCY